MTQVAPVRRPRKPVIPDVSGPVDLVITICTKNACDEEYNELRMVLRSFAKNFARLGRVFVAGVNPPPWLRLDQVVHLDVKDRSIWKDYNIITKVKTACENGISRHFIFCSDDQFLLRPSVPSDFWPRDEGHVSAWSQETWQRKLLRKTTWYQRLKHTADALTARGKNVFNFDSHHPVLMDSELFPKVVAEYGFDDPKIAGKHGFTVNSLYFNAIDADPLKASDLHRSPGHLPPTQTRFWNVNQHKYWAQALPFLLEKFPEPCQFEDPVPSADRRPAPIAQDNSLELVLQFIAEHKLTQICEFGAGRSTGAFLRAGCKVVTFETSETWIDWVVEDNADSEELECIQYVYPDIPVPKMAGELCYVDGPIGRLSNGREMPIAKAAEQRFKYIAVHDANRKGEAANIEKYLTRDYEAVVTARKLKIFVRRG